MRERSDHTGQTVGRLWSRYLGLRKEISDGVCEGEGRRDAERRVAQLRDRLVVNYSPMETYVASRVGARMTSLGRHLLLLREAYTLKEIGKARDPTEGRISQLLNRALGKLRERLKGSPHVSVGG